MACSSSLTNLEPQAHVRRDFWDLIYGESDLVHQRGHVKELDVDRQNRIGHNAHCMDYIRQLIVCRGDTTPEPHSSKPLGNGYPYQLDGYDTIHQCIDIVSIRTAPVDVKESQS